MFCASITYYSHTEVTLDTPAGHVVLTPFAVREHGEAQSVCHCIW